jgi:hypothetical protein
MSIKVDTGITEFARFLGCKEDSIRRAFQRLTDMNILFSKKGNRWKVQPLFCEKCRKRWEPTKNGNRPWCCGKETTSILKYIFNYNFYFRDPILKFTDKSIFKELGAALYDYFSTKFLAPKYGDFEEYVLRGKVRAEFEKYVPATNKPKPEIYEALKIFIENEIMKKLGNINF